MTAEQSLLIAFLNCGTSDISTLTDAIDIYENLTGDSISEIIDELKEEGNLDFNSILYLKPTENPHFYKWWDECG